MDCDQAIERLPWLLNGTLAPAERREVEAHVAECERCRAALADTRTAGEIFAQHIPSASLVAFAADEPGTISSETLERHLASCPQCAAELEMARASRALLENEGVATMPFRAPTGDRSRLRLWQGSALAASLVGLVAIGGWLSSAGQVAQLAAQANVRRAGTLAALPAATAGQVVTPNVALANLAPEGSAALRGNSAAPAISQIPSGREATLTLEPSARDRAALHDITLLDAEGRELAHQGGLVKDVYGYFDLSLRPLPPGEYTLQVSAAEGAERAPLDRFRFRVVEGKPDRPKP